MKKFMKKGLSFLVVVGVVFYVLNEVVQLNVSLTGCLGIVGVLGVIWAVLPYVLGVGVGVSFFRWLFGRNKNK